MGTTSQELFQWGTVAVEQALPQSQAKPYIASMLDQTGTRTRSRLSYELEEVGNRGAVVLRPPCHQSMYITSFGVLILTNLRQQWLVQCSGVLLALLYITVLWHNPEHRHLFTHMGILSCLADGGPPSPLLLDLLPPQLLEILNQGRGLRCTFSHHPKAPELCCSIILVLRRIIPHGFEPKQVSSNSSNSIKYSNSSN